jgi:predicted Fe-S protein YdhL (DUF1289 family)|tara:strand:- start:1278 stop:1559 length:282 start_codon:yes stop_codon:yes gene_type:complete
MADDKQPAQLEFFTIPSPCIGVCQSGPKGYCQGCFRSREERLYWLQIDDGTRRVILDACNRRKRYYQRRKSQSNNQSDTQPLQQDLFGDEPDK